MNTQQKLFVSEFLIDFNATAAYIRAKYAVGGAAQAAAKLMEKQEIKDAIEEGRAKLSRRCGVNAERVIQELARLAFSDMRDYVAGNEASLSFKAVSEWSADQAAAVAEISKVDTILDSKDDGTEVIKRTIKFKLYDKNTALEKLCKNLGLFAEDNSQAGKAFATSLMDLMDSHKTALEGGGSESKWPLEKSEAKQLHDAGS